MTRRRSLLLAIAAGVLLALSFPPRSWWFLAPLGVAGLALAIEPHGWRDRLLVGWLGGIAMFGTGFVLIWTPDVPAVVLAAEAVAALVLAALIAVVGVATPGGSAAVIGLPGALVLAAAAKARWPFGGLPGVGIAFGQVEGPLAHLAPLGSELAVIAGTALAGTALAALARRRVVVGTVLFGLVAATTAVGASGTWTEATSTIRVAAVQGGGPRGIGSGDDVDPLERTLAAAESVTAPVDLVVLPENIVHVDDPVADTSEGQQLSQLADRLDATVLAGIIERVGDDRFRNLAVAWGPDGAIVASYLKVHPVPFAEYVPGRSWLEDVVDLSLVPRDAVAGSEVGVIGTPAGTLGVLISFELFFPRLVRRVVAGGGQLLTVPTNAASFSGDQVPAFEVAATRLGAIATGRAAVQAAPTGYTAIIDEDGRVLARSRLGDHPAALYERLDLRRGETPFVRYGNLPTVVLATVALGGAWWATRRRTDRYPRR